MGEGPDPDENTRADGMEKNTAQDETTTLEVATRCVDERGVATAADGSWGEDDSERIIGTFERAPQLGQYFLLYPTGSGKTRKGAIFMLHLLRKGHVTRVVVIVPRHSLKRDTLLTYQAVFETHQRTQRDMSDVLKILTRKEFVNEWHAMVSRVPGTSARLSDWWSPTEVYGVFVDEFHTIISRSAAMVDDCTIASNTSVAADDSSTDEEEETDSDREEESSAKTLAMGSSAYRKMSKGEPSPGRRKQIKTCAAPIDGMGWTLGSRKEKKRRGGKTKTAINNGRRKRGTRKKKNDYSAAPPDKRVRTNESDGGYSSSSSSSSTSSRSSSPSSSQHSCDDKDADDEFEGPTGTDIVGYKGHARDAINQMRKHCPHNIFMCATATPFFTIFEKEVKMWVQIFEPSAATSLEDAMIYFGRRMITPTRGFVERVYSGVSVEIVGSDGTVGTPRMTEICAPVSASDFPLTGCNCGKCESEECYIERVMSEISSAREGKHFVVTYRYFVRDLLLDRLRRESTPCATAAAAPGGPIGAASSDSVFSAHSPSARQTAAGGPHDKKPLERPVTRQEMGGRSVLHQNKRAKSARGGGVHTHSVREEGLVGGGTKTGGGGAFASSSACAIRTFMWRDSVRVFYVLPDDPTNVVIQVRDEFNRERNRCIMVTNIFFCEGHTLRNVTHMHVLGAFPTYECGTMFQAFGRICRMKSHDAPTKVRVFMYDDDRMLHYRISKAVEKENEIRNGIKFMMKITERERQRHTDIAMRSRGDSVKKGGVVDCFSDDDACGSVDYSQLVAPYLTETSVADPPTTDTIHQIVSRFKQSRYSYVHSEAGTGMCLQDVSISDYIRRRNKEAAVLQAKQRELKSKRGVQPQRYNAIWKFITKKKLGPNCIFISIPEDVIAAAVASSAGNDAACAKGESQAPAKNNKNERAAAANVGGDGDKKKRGRGGGGSPHDQQLMLTIRVDDASGLWAAFGPGGSGAQAQHAEGNGGSATIKLPVTDVVVYNVRRHVICNEICRKMAKGALLINMPLSNIKRLQSGISRNTRMGSSYRGGGPARCGAAGTFPSAYNTTFHPQRADPSGVVASRSDDEDSSLISSSSSSPSSSSSSSSSSASDSSDLDCAAVAEKNKRRRAQVKRSERSLTRTRCDLIREILVWAAETECILVMK